MIYLSKVVKPALDNAIYPFTVPTIKNFHQMLFTAPITFLVGENGSGKSTFLESLAVAINSHTIGENQVSQDNTLDSVRLLADSYKISWKLRTHKGFFVRSEDVFGFTKNLKARRIELTKNENDFGTRFSGYGRQLAVGAMQGQRKAFENRYGQDLDANSHGETFLKVFQSRFVPGGLYLLDEPETPLSFRGQLSLLMMLKEMVKKDAQFIIATHSPILSAIPEAIIFSFDNKKIRQVIYDEIESFQLVKDFLNHPEAFLSKA